MKYQCVMLENDGRCLADGTVKAGGFGDWWYVCKEHVRWFSPAYMPRWWFYVFGTLIALVVFVILLVIVAIST